MVSILNFYIALFSSRPPAQHNDENTPSIFNGWGVKNPKKPTAGCSLWPPQQVSLFDQTEFMPDTLPDTNPTEISWLESTQQLSLVNQMC